MNAKSGRSGIAKHFAKVAKFAKKFAKVTLPLKTKKNDNVSKNIAVNSLSRKNRSIL